MASRNRVSYQCEAAYVGPPIISGHTINDSVEVLERVQSIDYSIDIPRADVSQLGKDGLIGAPIIEHPYVEASISYTLGSFRNEKAIGLNFNHNSTNVADSLADTFSSSLISGFSNKDNRNLDRKNYYVSLSEEGVDVVDNVTGIQSVVGFSKCYLNSWSSQGSVNGLITNTIGFTACDVQYFNSTGSVNMPEINFKRIKNLDTKTVVLPTYEATGTSALFPRDAKVSITSLTSLDKIGSKFTDLKLQDFNLDLSLQRRSVKSLGYRIPLDYELVNPSMATLNLSAIVGESSTGSLFSQVNDDQRDDVEMDLFSVTGCEPERQLVMTNKYVLKNAKVERISYSSSIGTNKTVSIGFSSDLDPEDLSKGLFLSGFVNT